MSNTTVSSGNEKEKYTASIAGSAFVTTENTLEVPPKENIFKTISSYVEEQGNLEIPTGDAKLNENGTLEMQDGTTLAMVNPKAYQILAESRKQKEERQAKSSRNAKVQSGESR